MLKTRLNALRTRLTKTLASPTPAQLKLQQEALLAVKEPLPVTDAEMESLIARSIEAVGLDPANLSLRQAVASTMLSLPQGTVKISVKELKDVINQARMKQAAYSVIEEIRAKDKAANEEAKQKAD